MFIESQLTTQENVIALVNLANSTDLKPEHITVINPVPYTPTEPDINNTTVTVKAVALAGYSGEVNMKYRRPDFQEVTLMPVRGFDVFKGMTPELLTPMAEISFGLPSGNLQVLPFNNNSKTVTIKAKDTSLLVVGEGVFALTWL
jgi:hypothetical protein